MSYSHLTWVREAATGSSSKIKEEKKRTVDCLVETLPGKEVGYVDGW